LSNTFTSPNVVAFLQPHTYVSIVIACDEGRG
jgi:hypothetical protein